MINPNMCELEDTHYDGECKCYVAYFIYPKDMSICEFYSEEDYGEVVSMCISVTKYEDGSCYMQASPTVREFDDAGEMLCDVDWRDLYEGIHYTDSAMNALLVKANI